MERQRISVSTFARNAIAGIMKSVTVAADRDACEPEQD